MVFTQMQVGSPKLFITLFTRFSGVRLWKGPFPKPLDKKFHLRHVGAQLHPRSSPDASAWAPARAPEAQHILDQGSPAPAAWSRGGVVHPWVLPLKHPQGGTPGCAASPSTHTEIISLTILA